MFLNKPWASLSEYEPVISQGPNIILLLSLFSHSSPLKKKKPKKQKNHKQTTEQPGSFIHQLYTLILQRTIHQFRHMKNILYHKPFINYRHVNVSMAKKIRLKLGDMMILSLSEVIENLKWKGLILKNIVIKILCDIRPVQQTFDEKWILLETLSKFLSAHLLSSQHCPVCNRSTPYATGVPVGGQPCSKPCCWSLLNVLLGHLASKSAVGNTAKSTAQTQHLFNITEQNVPTGNRKSLPMHSA